MKFKKYLYDKLPQIITLILGYIIILLLMMAFKIDKSLILAITIVIVIMTLIITFLDYLKKYKFYNNLLKIINKLDKKYLILEMLNKPNFYEGEILYEILYEVDKSMIENVKKYYLNIKDFKDYVEMWIHEVKIPISSLMLLNHNYKNNLDKKYVEQINKLDNYIDQILYYVRSENAEKDYLIKEIKVSEIIKKIALKNKDDLLENKVNLIVNVQDEKILTDEKWLEFILNQIINNSIKYKKENIESFIKIRIEEDLTTINLIILDNGIGIPKKDLPRVFEKSFTGENGRKCSKSTGMGLYIAKKLCYKLGHQINIESEKEKYTKIIISFSKNDFYKMNK